VKRRAVGTFLVLFALWPIAQYELTRRYGTDPWKLFGWAMYSVPGPMKTVRIVAMTEGGNMRRLDFRSYSPAEQAAVDAFRERSRALGHLASSEPLARAMLELNPDFEGVVIATLAMHLDPATGLLARRIEYATYWRDGRDQRLDLSEMVLERLFGP
jgi:hypothetical protein